jgi:hypothetical protein
MPSLKQPVAPSRAQQPQLPRECAPTREVPDPLPQALAWQRALRVVRRRLN